MQYLISVLILFTCIFAATCVAFRSKNKSLEGMICKFMASFGFISIAIIGHYQNPANRLYFVLILFALMFGFCGDVFLGIKEIAPTFKKKLIPVGAIYFLIGHVFYMFAFSSVKGFEPLTIIAMPVGFAISLIMIKALKMPLKGPVAIVLSIYYGMLIWKVVFTAWLVHADLSAANILCLVASALFFISDTCLAFLYFTPVKKKNPLVTAELSTYYPAQILFALSVLIR